jgi:hypothetical protein
MRNLRLLTIVGSLACGFASSALAGAGSLNATMTPLGNNVTYSIASPVLETFVGYVVTFNNSGGNTINNISFTVTARATDPAESVVLFSETQYLPSSCTKTAPSVFTCNVGQLKSGEAFPSFQVFYKAPTKVTNGTADDDHTDFVDLHMSVVYAEQLGGVPTSPPANSTGEFDTAPTGSVELGTSNPDSIKSAVPKGGASLYTGIGGIPSSTNKSTMLAKVPPLSATQTSTTADLLITRVTDDPISGDAECITQGHFRECPTYSVTIPGTFAFLTTTYRIDASSLKMAPNKILTSVIIKYSDPAASIPETIVGACPAANTPLGTGVPCINKQVCYKNNAQPPSIAGDCEWELINTKNGLTKFF